MPTISVFYGIIIRMYYDDHNPPHFHAFYGDYKAIFDFDGKVLELRRLIMIEVIKAEAIEDYKLKLTFDNGETKIKDMKPYLDKGIFKKLKDINVFNNVKIKYGTISWEDDIDMCADSLYETSKTIE